MGAHNIVKYLRKKGTTDLPKKYIFRVLKTTNEDPRGFELEGFEGKFLQIMNNLPEDAGKNILSISPVTNPALGLYEEVPRVEAETLLANDKANKEAELATINAEKAEAHEIADAADDAKIDKLIAMFEAGDLYGGDVDVFEAAHGFTPAEHVLKKEKKQIKKDKKNK